MNILLVSVTERTRKTGTQLTIGARENILTQLLTEAIVSSLTGDILGVLFRNFVFYKATDFSQREKQQN